jgi:hypothetical protein
MRFFAEETHKFMQFPSLVFYPRPYALIDNSTTVTTR